MLGQVARSGHRWWSQSPSTRRTDRVERSCRTRTCGRAGPAGRPPSRR